MGHEESRERVKRWRSLTTESVQSATLSLEGVDNIERGDSLALSMLGVSDSIPDDTLKESLQNTTCFFIYH